MDKWLLLCRQIQRSQLR